MISFLPNLGLAAILLVGGREVINGTLSLGDFTAFYAYLLMLISPMRTLGVHARRGPARDRLGRAHLRDPRPRARDDRRPTDAPALPAGPDVSRSRTSSLTFEGSTPPGAQRRRPRDRGRLHGRARRRDGLGQDRARLAAAAALRRERRIGPDRRRRRPLGRLWPACVSEIAIVNDDPFLFSATVHDNIAYARPEATREEVEERRSGRAGGRLHPRAAGGLRHARRRARPDALRRPAPADRDRPRDPGQPADPDPRRRHLVGRRLDRAGDQARAARGDGRTHDVRDRAPPLDDRARRRDRRARGRRGRRRTATTTSCSSAPTLYREIVEKGMPDQVFLTRKPVEAEVAGPMSARSIRICRRPPACRPAGAGASCAAWPRCSRPTAGASWRCSSRWSLATAAALAPAPLAKLAIDNGINHHDVAALDADRRRLPRLGGGLRGRHLRADLPRRLGRAARAPGSAHAAVRAPAALSIGFYSRNRAGVIISRLTNDVEALDQLVSDGIATLFQSGADADRRRRDPVRDGLAARAADVHRAAAAGDRRARLPDRLGRRVPAARARRSRRSPATCRSRCRASGSCARSARSAATSPASAQLNEDNRAANMTTVNLNAAYFPASSCSRRWSPWRSS